jgi:Tfp pilus assembly protein PilN
MRNHKKLNLNLATNPMRNRRLFLFLLAFLGISICLVLIIGGKIYYEYRGSAQEAKREVVQIESRISSDQKVANKLSINIEELNDLHAEDVELINSLVYSKSFSWMDFFSALEDALPASSYIVSLRPYPEEGISMEVRFKVASASMNELLKFIARLAAKGFKDIQILSESKSQEGYALSEISIRYERNI